jgi:hypothetical protein
MLLSGEPIRGVHEGQEQVDQSGAGEEPVEETEAGAKEPARPVHGDEDGVVAAGEEEAEAEVGHVADGFGPGPVHRHDGPEEEGQVDAVSRSSLAARSIVVSRRVPVKPPARAPPKVAELPPQPPPRRR